MANLLIDVLKLVKVFLTVYVWRVVHLASLPAAISSSLRHLVPNLYALFDIFVLGSTATWSHTARRNTTSAACNVLGPSSRVLAPATSASADVSLSPLRPNTTLAADRMSPLLSARTRRGSDSTLPSDQEDAAQTGLEADAEDESPALGLRMRHRRAVAAAPQAQLSHEDLLVFAYVPPWLPASVWLPFYRPSRPGSFPFTASSSNSSNSSSRSALQTAAHEDASSSDASSCADGEIRMARRLPPHVQASLHAAAAAVDSSPSVRRPLPCRMPGSKILVLDLDDTLLCTSTTATRYTIPPTYSEAIPTAAGADLYYVWERPHVGLFLQCVSQWYHLVAFTAASQPYADVLLDRLERRAGRAPNKLFRRRLYRGDCTPAPQGGVSRIACGGRPDGSINRGATAPPLQTFWKDLNKVGTPLGRTLLLDDALESFTLQPENGLQCPRYVPPRPTSLLRPASTPMLPVDGSGPSRDKDRALLDLLPFLEALAHTWDVRAVLTHQIHLSAAKRGGTQPLA